MRGKVLYSLVVLLVMIGPALGGTTRYEFVEAQSTVVQSGGIMGIYITYSVAGRFVLTVDFGAGVASFDEVDANLSEIGLSYTQNLNELFNMTELVGTVISDTQIHFVGKNTDIVPVDVNLMVTLADGSVVLTGGTEPGCCDFFIYDLDAVAVESAKTIYVDDDGPADFNTIQAAIDDSNDGDIIIIVEGNYTGDGNRDIDFGGRAITVRSTNPNDPNVVAATVVDCQGSMSNRHRGFSFNNGESCSSILSGLTITNGYGNNGKGGCIYCNSSSPVIQNCRIMNNVSTYEGGGLYFENSSAHVLSNEILGNEVVGIPCSTEGRGGGIYCLNCPGLLISGNNVNKNVAVGYDYGMVPYGNDSTELSSCSTYHAYGGGIYVSGDGVTVEDNHFSQNKTTNRATIPEGTGGYGGAIFITLASSDSLIESNSFLNNEAISGGAIANSSSSTITMRLNTFGSNSALFGSAIYCNGSSGTMISENNISGNQSTFGVIVCSNSSPVIVDNIVANNSKGIWCKDSPAKIQGNTITGNHSTGITCSSGAIITNNIITGNYCASEARRGGGGGIRLNVGSSAKVVNNLIIGNSARKNGGGICLYDYTDCLLENNTIYNNTTNGYGGGLYCYYGVGNVRMANCIVRGNTGGQISGNVTVSYSNIQGGRLGEGNVDADPNFADPGDGDYHLKSQAGRWEPNSQSWVQDDVTSPCIDAGDWMSPIGLEPFPNGGRVNMGAYGGTAEASKSYFGEPVCEIIVAGDVNGDCIVNYEDFAIMALHWLRDENQ